MLAAWVNGPGTRDRLALASDGAAVYAFGVGRGATTRRTAAPGTVQVAIIRPQASRRRQRRTRVSLMSHRLDEAGKLVGGEGLEPPTSSV